jgi:DNA polymerase-3 subunit beta
MKMTCQRAALANAFQTVSGVIPARTPKEILQNTRLEAANGEATLLATDLDVGVRHRLPECMVDRPGTVLMPTHRVLAILREMQGPTVQIEVQENVTRVTGNRAEYRLGYLDPAEFPLLPAFDEQNSYTVSSNQLRRMIQRTIFAIDAESTRYALGGVLVELHGESVILVATDTRRLAQARGQCASSGEAVVENSSPVVPAKAMALIERSLADYEGSVAISIRANDVQVQSNLTTIYSRLVEGRFPKYQDVIPTKNAITIDLIAAPLLTAVRQAQILTSEEHRGVDFEFGPGLLKLISREPSAGESVIELPISYEGEALTVTFDPRFIAEFLKVLEPEQPVRLGLTNSASAAVFRTEDGYTYIVMPLSRER